MLTFGEQKLALKTLSFCYTQSNNEEKKYEIWERLIKIDYDEADIVKNIADRKKDDGKIEEAVDYYKKALFRYINRKAFHNVKELWNKLLVIDSEDANFFLNTEKKVAVAFDSEKATQLLYDFYNATREKENWDLCISVLKRIVDYNPKDPDVRKQLIECYKKKYEAHSKVENYIEKSELNKDWRNIHEAISDFEKHISFDAGTFVGHRTWGIGVIRSIDNEVLIIDFASKRNHPMSLDMAVTALTCLPKNHIWVLKSVIDKKRLHDRVKSDPHWALKTVISSFNNQASLKQIKTELVPSILTPTEWNTWSKEAKNILDRDSEFGNLPDQTDVFTVRDTPITVEEKLYNNFKANPKFYSRVKVMREFLKECQPDSEYFNEMYTYFTSYLKEIDRPNDINVSAYILIREIVKEYPYLNPGIDKHFKDIFKDKNRLVSVFERIEDAEIRKSFIRFVKEFSDWPIIYMKLFPKCLNRSILEDLAAQNRSDCISQMFEEIASNFREDRTAFIWLMKNAEEYKDLCKIQEETFVINAIQLLSTLYKEMDNRYNVSENRKLAQQIESILFKEGRLEKTIQKISSDKLSKIYSLVNEIKGLSLALKQDVRRMISETHPEFQFGDEQSKTLSARDIISRSLLVLQRSHQAHLGGQFSLAAGGVIHGLDLLGIIGGVSHEEEETCGAVNHFRHASPHEEHNDTNEKKGNQTAEEPGAPGGQVSLGNVTVDGHDTKVKGSGQEGKHQSADLICQEVTAEHQTVDEGVSGQKDSRPAKRDFLDPCAEHDYQNHLQYGEDENQAASHQGNVQSCGGSENGGHKSNEQSQKHPGKSLGQVLAHTCPLVFLIIEITILIVHKDTSYHFRLPTGHTSHRILVVYTVFFQKSII